MFGLAGTLAFPNKGQMPGGARSGNIQQPTSNIEPPRTGLWAIIGCWVFDVGCWMFPGFMGRATVLGRGVTQGRTAPPAPPRYNPGLLSLILSGFELKAEVCEARSA